MRTALLSDVHGNRHAFEAVLAATAEQGVDAIWCLGDLVGYGADPNACVALARERCSIVLAGNHDLAVTGDLSLEEFSRGAALAAHWTQSVIDDEHLEFLRSLSPRGEAEGVGLYHASPRDPIWEYVLSSMLADLCLTAQPERISAVGHSHVALSFSRDQEAEASGTPREIGEIADLTSGEWLINPGSVGQPRDGDPRAAWLLLDTGRGPPSGGASSTTSKAPRRRSGRRASRIARGSPRVRSVAVRRSALLLVTAFAVGLLAAFAASCAGNGVKGGLPQSSADDLKAQISDVGGVRRPRRLRRHRRTAAPGAAGDRQPARVDRRGARRQPAPGRRAAAGDGDHRVQLAHRDDAADPDADGAAGDGHGGDPDRDRDGADDAAGHHADGPAGDDADDPAETTPPVATVPGDTSGGAGVTP